MCGCTRLCGCVCALQPSGLAVPSSSTITHTFPLAPLMPLPHGCPPPPTPPCAATIQPLVGQPWHLPSVHGHARPQHAEAHNPGAPAGGDRGRSWCCGAPHRTPSPGCGGHGPLRPRGLLGRRGCTFPSHPGLANWCGEGCGWCDATRGCVTMHVWASLLRVAFMGMGMGVCGVGLH
jgi:hypothetical protein